MAVTTRSLVFWFKIDEGVLAVGLLIATAMVVFPVLSWIRQMFGRNTATLRSFPGINVSLSFASFLTAIFLMLRGKLEEKKPLKLCRHKRYWLELLLFAL